MTHLATITDLRSETDEFLMIELRGKEVAEDQIDQSWPQPRQIAERMMVFLTGYQRGFAQYPLTLHASELRSDVAEARSKLCAYVDEILSHLPPFLPSHIDHPQWDYHLPGFIEARHQFLSAKLGSWTERTEPPASLPTTDRIWWELDGIHKMFSRRRNEIQETRSQLLGLIRREIAEVDNEMATLRGALDREFVREIASVQNDFIQCGPGNVSGSPGADCTGNSIARAEAEQSHANALAALMDRYEEKLGQIQSPPC